jgi:hypothetical protein
MQTRRFILILGLLLTVGKILPAQVSSNSYSMEISGKPIRNVVSGEMISEGKLHELITANSRLILDPVINKYGEVESFLYYPDTKNYKSARDTSKRTKVGEPFPPFYMRSINGKKLDSEKLLGKPVLIQFQLFMKAPFFNANLFHQLDSLAEELKTAANLETIVVTQSDKEEIKNSIAVGDYKIDIVPDGRNFSIRYLVTAFPSYILTDREGKLVRYYDGSDLSRLRHDIKTQFSK